MSNWIGTAWCDTCLQIVDIYWEENHAECGFCGKKIEIKSDHME